MRMHSIFSDGTRRAMSACARRLKPGISSSSGPDAAHQRRGRSRAIATGQAHPPGQGRSLSSPTFRASAASAPAARRSTLRHPCGGNARLRSCPARSHRLRKSTRFRIIRCSSSAKFPAGFALASTALGALLAATPALAEAEAEAEAAAAEAADDSGIVDIVVTAARRRDESAQDVPVALSVVSAASLERARRLQPWPDPAAGAASAGVQLQSAQHQRQHPGAWQQCRADQRRAGKRRRVYIDNVYYGRVGTSQFDLVDLDRIEVLRGPQGTPGLARTRPPA